jgi:Tol biopolymer transport system component
MMPDNSKMKMFSALQSYNIETGERTLLKEFDYHLEAPNWTPDGKALVYNSKGQIYRFDLTTKESTHIPTGQCTGCNNDHVISKDGKTLAISASTADQRESRVWVLPITGGEPTLITEKHPSYLHGISPDGKTLAYCASRDGEYDVYTMSIDGGAETQLTFAPGLSDGPEYSPDGKTIWFNSVRTGLMQAWKMNADGSDQTQMTFDEGLNTWFPHISPDNKKAVYVSYYKGDVKPGDHPANKDIEVRLMDSDGKNLKTLFKAFGGQGTMNVNSWSPDSKCFAFVTYRFE